MSEKLINSISYLVFIVLTVSIVGCNDKEDAGSITMSSGSVVDDLTPKWKEEAAKGDLNAAYALAIWKSENNIKREEKLIELAKLGHERSMLTLYDAYRTGTLLGIKKDCSSAWKWYDEIKKIFPEKVNLMDIIKECPK